MSDSTKKDRRPIYRPDGVTATEQYLRRLCERSFLSLWSYPAVYRDQGNQQTGEGKEVCDLLVVFQNQILIFSDKYCAFPQSGNHALDWCRWFRRAVWKSAEQVWGAERWIRANPSRLFLDRACAKPFPIDLPDPAKAEFHRIVVAHGVSRPCREKFGGTGTMMLNPAVTGAKHYADPATVKPFVIGDLEPSRGFVHVLDDASLDAVMRELDTAPDFIKYLTRKERLVREGKLTFAAGEDDLLAYYLSKVNEQEEHDFVIPQPFKSLQIEEGLWEHHVHHPQRLARDQANRVSYAWDKLIESFSHTILTGTWYDEEGGAASDREKVVRLLASEGRTVRRMLANALLGLIASSPPDLRAARVVIPEGRPGPYYVFLLLPTLPEVSVAEYRQVRLGLLKAYCKVVKAKFPEAADIVGIATEPGSEKLRSEDAVYLDGAYWNEELQTEAEGYQRDLGLLAEHSDPVHFRESEYPNVKRALPQPLKPGRGTGQSFRNLACPCGSGRKVKRCCGARRGPH